MKTELNSKITTATFESLNHFSEFLYYHQNKLPYHIIQRKVSQFLVENGDKNFVKAYNHAVETKDFMKALTLFKIY